MVTAVGVIKAVQTQAGKVPSSWWNSHVDSSSAPPRDQRGPRNLSGYLSPPGGGEVLVTATADGSTAGRVSELVSVWSVTLPAYSLPDK